MNSLQETQLGRELRQLVSGQPFTPDIEAIGLRARQRHRRGLALRGATAAGAAVLAAGGLLAAVHGTGGTTAGTAASRAPAVKSKLMSLAALIKARSGPLPGNASLVIGKQVIGGKPMQVGYGLYTDSGDLYSGDDKQTLVAAVAHHSNLADFTERARDSGGALRGGRRPRHRPGADGQCPAQRLLPQLRRTEEDMGEGCSGEASSHAREGD